MADVSAVFGGAFQAQAALSFTGVARDFSRGPGVLSGLRLIDTVAEVVGVERLTGQLVKYAVKLVLRSDQSAADAGAEMVALMRSRVAQDTGDLLNGITWRREGRTVVVEAAALSATNNYDYALAVEAGHHAGGSHVDASFFDDTTGRGHGYERRESDVPAQPFFYSSAREVLGRWAGDLGGSITTSAREEGL